MAEPAASIYGAVALHYLERGWKGVLPLPPGQKTWPPSGYTGKEGVDPAQETIAKWVAEHSDGNVALRLPDGIIGIDVDAYGNKRGAQTLAELEAKLGPLPPTWSTSSRDDDPISGIRYFRVPLGLQWPESAGPHIEIIRKFHRYAVVPPSIHPTTGKKYRWRDAAGHVSLWPPSPQDFPELPPTWVAALSKPATNGRHPATAAPTSVESFFAEKREFTDEEAEKFCAPFLNALRDATEGSRNNRLNAAAKVLSHFVPAFCTREKAEELLDEALDPEYPRAEARATIASAFASADKDWKAQRVERKTEQTEWEDPVPLIPQPDPLPLDSLGPVAGPMVGAVAKSIQVPTDLAIAMALPIIATAARGQVKVQVGSDWVEPLTICSVACLPSGERKSAASRALADPLYRFEAEAQTEAAPRIARNREELKLKEERVNRLRVEAAKSGEDASKQEFFTAVDIFQSHETEYPPRFITDDATPEGLVRLLHEQGGSIGAISAEAGLLGVIAGRYNGGNPNLEVVLQATSGDPIRVDRKGSEPVSIQSPALSLGLAVQPGLLADLGSKSAFRHAGLLARFLWAVPQPMVGTRTTEEHPIPYEVSARWSKHLSQLAAAALQPKAGPRLLGLSREARQCLDRFRNQLEPRLHPTQGDLAGISDWGSKLPGQVVRIAAALTLLRNPAATQIDGTTMADAVRLGQAFIPHALAAFSQIHEYAGGAAHSAEILSWLIQKKMTSFTTREVCRGLHGRSWAAGTDTIENGLNVLAEFGHIRVIEQDENKRGRPTKQYELHPKYLNDR